LTVVMHIGKIHFMMHLFVHTGALMACSMRKL
jgi:hypothetical protein